MNKPGNDSDEVVRFMELFARLKSYCDDLPNELGEQAANDSSVMDLCINLWFAALSLKQNERRARQRFAAPTNPSFVSAWRDFEERYEIFLTCVFFSNLMSDLDTTKPTHKTQPEVQWEVADDAAKAQARGICEAIEQARHELEYAVDAEFADRLEVGLEAWDSLTLDSGLDLRGILRRRELVPFVLVPRSVATKQSNADKLSLLTNLQQAQDAFIFGAPYAALALMRSIMEAMLRDHYDATGKDLNELINRACKHLPRGANAAALHRLRKRANSVLHLERRKDEELPNIDKLHLEREIVSLLFVLRALIEGRN